MSKITYSNKVSLNPQPSIADINKCTADDMNEIKTVVNTNDDNTTANTTAITNLQTYSTNEVDTGKTWVDGKKIYRKVLTGTTTTTNAAFSISHGISNFGIVMIDNKSFVKSTGGGNTFIYPVNCPPNVSSDYNARPIRAYINNENVSLYIGAYNGYTSFDYAIILEYTKTS